MVPAGRIASLSLVNRMATLEDIYALLPKDHIKGSLENIEVFKVNISALVVLYVLTLYLSRLPRYIVILTLKNTGGPSI